MSLENNNSHWDCFITMKRWMENRNAGKSFVDYFKSYGYKRIGIYGAGDIGKLLYEEIKDSDIKVAYFVDRNADALKVLDEIPVITIQEILEMDKVDALVITPIGNYGEINRTLVQVVPEMCTISLKDAVYEF